MSHALKYASGDRSDDHLAAVRANAGMLIWFEEQGERGAEKPSGAHEMAAARTEAQAVGQLGWVIPEAEKMTA